MPPARPAIVCPPALVHYWINPDRESERARWMASEFERTGVRHKRVAACTPDSLRPMLLPRELRQSQLQLACLCSHFTALDQGFRDGDDVFMIMEDDMTLPFAVNFQALLARAPRHWEILQLYVVNAERLERMYQCSYAAGYLWERWSSRNYSCGAYICSRRGAERLLGIYLRGGVLDFSFYTHPLVADDIIYRTARTYTLTYPLYVEHSGLATTIGSRREFHLESHAAVSRIWEAGVSPSFAVRHASDALCGQGLRDVPSASRSSP